jgi:ribonuclease P protein component
VKREQRLRSPADFRRVRDVARRGWSHPLLVVYVAPNDLDRTRVGITVSGRIGKAVVRNRVRRRLWAALGARFDQLPRSADVVVAARPPSAQASWAELCAAVDAVLGRARPVSVP